MSFDTKIFHDYDIRGIYPDEINEDKYTSVGQALALFSKEGPIAVGSDMRLSSPTLKKALIDGITSYGVDVVDLGMISTEILYFAAGKYRYPLSAIVSASHNPPQYNGLKTIQKGMVALNGNYGFPQLKSILGRGLPPPPDKKGVVSEKNILSDWIAHLLTFIDSPLKPLKVVIDAGNGMSGITWQELMTKLPIHIIPLYFEPNGTFPHHIPNPLEEANLTDLKKKILEEKADLGFAFDGDADRFFILDEEAHVLSGTVTTAILASHLLKKEGAAPVLYNAICGRIVPETIKKYGGTPKRVRVGHSFIKQYMKEYEGLFAGEHSGHYYFRDNHNADSSAIAALLFLEYLSQSSRKVSEIRKEFDIYPQSGELNFRAPNIPQIIETIRHDYALSATSTDDIDGLSIWYKDFWFNLRSSKTEPLLRLNIEADNQKILTDKQKELITRLKFLGASAK